MGLVFRSDGVGAVAELEVFCLGEVLYQSLTDGLGFALRDVLLEVEHTTCHLSLDVGTEVGAGISDYILAVGVNNTIYCIVFIYDIFVNITIYVYSIFYRRPKLLLAKIGVVGIIPYEVSG